MGMVVRTNTMALNAYRQLGMNNSAVAKSLEKLSSGFRINRAGDDAAGLAISEKMKAQITGLETASANAQDGISLIQTAEGNLTEVHSMLNRMVELATKSANGTYTSTERRALQDEVDSLLDEINRISQSANFNGTRLLDGSMGLNTEAFTITGAAARDASDGTIDISSIVAKEADGTPKVHMEEKAVTAATPGATIDLGDLTITGVKANDTVAIKVGDTTYTVKADADDAFDTTAGIATALKAAIAGDTTGVQTADGTHSGTATDNDGIRIGDAVYTIGGAGSTITLTYAGRFDSSGTYKAEAAFDGTAGEAAAMNGKLGFDVTVGTISSATGTRAGDVIHKATNVSEAAAAVNASKAGIDIKLSDLVKDGNTLTIDGKTFFFKTDANTTATTGTTEIDVSSYKEEDWVHAAADLLSKQTVTGQENRTWKIGVNGDGTTIHIDQTAASGTGKELNTYDKLVGVISAKGQTVTAANVGTNIKIDNAKVKEGDTLNIDGKTYVFSDKKTGTDSDTGAIYVAIKGGAAQNLKTAIGDDAEINAAKDTVTVRAANADDEAPIVLGRGLVLQIGDTADSFNKMTVSVRDMSPTGLNLNGLSIMTEDSASAAIDKIKTAINTVSTARAGMGALQNRLEHTINNLDVAVENLSAANSRIRDTDMAKEMMNYTKMNVLVQSAQAMLAQANQQPQSVLQLLQ